MNKVEKRLAAWEKACKERDRVELDNRYGQDKKVAMARLADHRRSQWEAAKARAEGNLKWRIELILECKTIKDLKRLAKAGCFQGYSHFVGSTKKHFCLYLMTNMSNLLLGASQVRDDELEAFLTEWFDED